MNDLCGRNFIYTNILFYSITDGDDSRSVGITHLSSQNSHSIEDEFMKLSERKKLDEIPDTNKVLCIYNI